MTEESLPADDLSEESDLDEVEESQESEQPEQAAESAPAQDEDDESSVSLDEKQQKFVNDLIAKKTWERREAERQYQAQLEERDQRIQQLQQYVPQETRPEVPPLPDPYDDDYEEKVRARDEAIERRVAFDERKRLEHERAQQAQLQEQQQTLQQLHEVASTFQGRANEVGIDESALTEAATKVGQYQLGPHLTLHMMQDEQGPQVVKYLADNPVDAEQVARLAHQNVLQAAIYIETNVKPKATRRKFTSAPEPSEPLNGGGVRNSDPLLKGATFE